MTNVRRRVTTVAASSVSSGRAPSTWSPRGGLRHGGRLGRLPPGVRHRCRGPGRALRKDSGRHLGGRPTYLADAFAAAQSFKVESKRADKTFPMNSIQLSQAVGGDLAGAVPHVAVDVHKPGSDGICGDPGERRLCPCPCSPAPAACPSAWAAGGEPAPAASTAPCPPG